MEPELIRTSKFLSRVLRHQPGMIGLVLDAGLLRAGRDLTEHVSQLAATLATADPTEHSNRAFVEAFVRR